MGGVVHPSNGTGGDRAALEDPDGFFEALDDDATAYYMAIRGGMLAGVNRNNGTIGCAELLDRMAWANQTSREIVGVDTISIPRRRRGRGTAGRTAREGAGGYPTHP